MKRSILAVIILISMMGVAAFAAPKGLAVPGDLTVTGTTGVTGKIFSPSGVNAVGGTVEADHFIGEGSQITGITADYAILSATASQAADLNLSGQVQGAIAYFNGTNWVVLVPGTAGNTLRSSGVGADPLWAAGSWKQVGSTIETYASGLNLALDSDAKFYMNNLRDQYLRWNSSLSTFQFTDGVSADSFTGSGAALTNLNAANIASGVVPIARGGLNNDTSSAQTGAILYYDGTKWHYLQPGTYGDRLTTLGTGAAPVWVSAAFGMHIDLGPGIGGGPLTSLTGTIELLLDQDTLGINGNGSVEVVRAPLADYATLSGNASSAATVIDGAISASKLTSGAVTSGAIAVGTITAANMGAGSITKDAIAAADGGSDVYLKWDGSSMLWAIPPGGSGSVEVDNLTAAFNVNGSIEVKAGGISASRLATGSVTSAAIADGAISAAKLGTGVVTSGAIALNTITAANLANGSVTSGAIALNTITAANMGNNSVTQAAIAAAAPGSGTYLRWNGVSLDWVTPAGITGSLEVDEISVGINVNGSIEVKDSGITSAKIADNTISAADLANGAVTSGAIALNAITAANMGTNSVTQAAIANNSVDGAKLAADINITTTGYVTAETVRATTFYGSGAGITGVTVTTAAYAVLSGTASKAADLIITGQATGELIYFSGTKWVTLEPGIAGSTLRSGGSGAAPYWLGNFQWKSTGSTLEPVIAGFNVRIDSGAKYYMDNSASRYVMWDQGATKFLFNGTVSADAFTGPGSGLTGLNAGNISTGILGLTNGGLGIDTFGAGNQGSVLYHNGTTWAMLAPGTSGYHLRTNGAGSNPTWAAAGSVTSIGAGRGLTTTTNPITTTGVLTIDTLVVVTTADAQILTNKTINSGLIDGTTSINTTGVATFAASGFGVFVNNDAFIQGKLAIGATGFLPPPSTETLRVDAGPSNSLNVISGYGDVNGNLGLNIKNKNAGGSASSNITAFADNATEYSGFISMGINSSTYSTSYLMGPNDTYVAGLGNSMYIGTVIPGQPVVLFSGGSDPANKRLMITGNGLVGIATMEPTATLEVAGNMKVGVGAAAPGANGLSVAGNLKVGGGVSFSGNVTFEGSTYIKSGKNLSLGDTTSGSSNLLVPFAFSGTPVAGDVVVLDTGAPNTVQTTTEAKAPNVVGFVQRIEGTTAYVAVAGRITTAVANQAIAIGDAICTSTTAGRVNGHKNLQIGKMIGIAVSAAAGSGNSVSVLIYKY